MLGNKQRRVVDITKFVSSLVVIKSEYHGAYNKSDNALD